MTPTAHREAGFVLLEAVTALFLGALIFTTMLLAGDMVARRLDSAFAKAGQIEMLGTGLAALRHDLRSALPVLAGDREDDTVLFSGTEDSLSFVSGPNGLGERLEEQALRIEARPEGLVRWAVPLLPGARDFDALRNAKPAILISGPWSFRFAYADELSPAPRWQERWTVADELPKLVRLDIIEKAEPRRTLLSLEIAPRVNAGFPAPDHDAAAEVVATDQTGAGQ